MSKLDISALVAGAVSNLESAFLFWWLLLVAGAVSNSARVPRLMADAPSNLDFLGGLVWWPVP